MPLLAIEAAKLSNNQLEAGVIEEIIERDETFALLPFMQVVGKAYVYDRENTIAGADFLDPNDVVNEEASTFTEVVAKLRILIGDVDVDKFLAETQSDTNDQLAVQLAMKAKGLARKFKQTFIMGDNATSPKQFDGIAKLVTSAQTIDAGTGGNGGALNLSLLDQLCDMVINGADALVMRPGTIRAYRALLRATGGTDASMMEIANFGVPVLSHNGTPILRNDYLPANETLGTGTALCSVYAVRFNEADGLHGIYGGASAGVRVEDIGTVQNKDATRTRLKWYCGLALKSTKSLARLRGVSNT